MSYVVHGARGAQGHPVLKALLTAGELAVRAVRKPGWLPKGCSPLLVDYDDLDSLIATYRSAKRVLIHLPIGAVEDGLVRVRTIAEAVDRDRPGRVVLSTSGQIVDDPDSILQVTEGSPIEILCERIEAIGVASVVLAPRLYLEDLPLAAVAYAVRAECVFRYPLLAEFPVSWNSYLDVTDVAVALLTDSAALGTVAAGHRPALNDHDLAAGFGRYLNRSVQQEGISRERFGERLLPPLCDGVTKAVIHFYATMNAALGSGIGAIRSAARSASAPYRRLGVSSAL